MNDAAKSRRRVVLQQASDWLVRLQDDRLGDADLEAWGRWMAASPEHAAAFDEMSVLWDVSASLDSATVLMARADRSAMAGPKSRHGIRMHRRHPGKRKWIAVAAAAVVAAVGIWFLVLPRSSRPAVQVFATELGQQRHVTLGDGSQVDLDAGSEIHVRFSAARRDIDLVRGQAFFSVVHAPRRPFVVRSGQVESRALGTRFSVAHRAPGMLAVNVLEGRVRVSAPAGSGQSGNWFDAGMGQRVDYTRAQGLEPPKGVNVEMATAWRSGVMVYQGEALANVISDLNRYSAIPVRLADPAQGQIRVTGRWELKRTGHWLEGLAQTVGMDVLRGPGGIMLSRPARAGAEGHQALGPGAGAG